MRDDVVANRVHQMGLAEPDSAVNEQRVIRPRRGFRHSAAGRVGKLVRRPNNERVKRVPRTKDANVIAVSRIRLGLLLDCRRFRDIGNQRHAQVLRNKGYRRAGALNFRERFLDHRRVVLRQPVAEERVGNAHADRAVTIRDERRRLEPRVETVPVDLRLDAGEDLVPDIAAGHVCFVGPFAPPPTMLYGSRSADLPFTRQLQGG